MEFLTNPIPIRQIDLRKALGVAAATMNEITKKAGLEKHKSKLARNLSPEESRLILEHRGIPFPTGEVKVFMTGKGGVGKTTTAYYLATRLSSYGAKVLLIDSDPSGNLTLAANLDKWGYELNAQTKILSDVFTGKCSLEDTLIKIHSHLHLVPSTPVNSVLENRIRENYKNPFVPMRIALEPIKNNYNYILIDCGPTLNLINTVMMYAADHIIMPLNPDIFSRTAIDQTFHEIEIMSRDYPAWKKPKMNILFTRFDARELLSMKYLLEIAEEYEDYILNITIGASAAFKNAIEKKVNIYDVKDKNAKKGRDDYDMLAREIIGLKIDPNKILEN